MLCEEEPMNCPKCGNRMELGTVYSPRGYLFWTPEQEKLKNFQRPKGAVRLRPVGDRTKSAFSSKALSELPQYAGAICRNCGAVLFSFENKE